MGSFRTVIDNLKKGAGFFYGWVVLGVLFINMVVGFTIRNTFSVLYPAIIEEFGWGRGSTALMFSITILVGGLMSPIVGSWVDWFRPKLILAVGGCIAGGSFALLSQATTLWQFYLVYGVIVAVGLSMVGWIPASVIASSWFTTRRSLAFGILAAGFGSSLLSAPIAQSLISAFGWQNTCVIIGVFASILIVPLCILFVYRKPVEKELLPDDTPKILPESLDSNNPRRQTSWEEKRSGTSWTLLEALRTYRLWLLFLIAICMFGIVETTVIAHQVYFFRDAGYEPMMAASIYSVFGLAFMVGNLSGSFSDYLGREKVFISSCVLTFVAVTLLFFIKDTSQPWLPFLFAIGFGLGIGTGGPVFNATIADLFYGKSYGSIQGFVFLGYSIGGAISPWLAGFIYDKTDSYFLAFLILLGSLAVSAVSMLLIAPRKVRPLPGNVRH